VSRARKILALPVEPLATSVLSLAQIRGDCLNPFINRMRGLLAILVAAGHVAAICAEQPTRPDFFQAGLTPALMFTGFNYVIGFIVISGYCIARSTWNKPFSFSGYLWSRSTRIYPCLVACGLLAGVVELALYQSHFRVEMWSGSINVGSFVYTLLGVGGFFGTFGAYAPSYTVSFELLFYLLWGIALAVFPRRLVIPACLLAVPVFLVIFPYRFHFALVLFLVWLIGVTISVFEGRLTEVATKVPLWAIWLISLFLLICGNSAVFNFGVNIWKLPGSLVTIPCGLLFGAVILGHLARHSRTLSLDDWLGEISYPLFLSHGAVIIAIGALGKMVHSHTSFGVMFIWLMASSLIASHFIVIKIERPLMKWRHSRSSRSVMLMNIDPAGARLPTVAPDGPAEAPLPVVPIA
jgi:peptidoglycan/LPS O-acetylase OafA/YrhL